MTEIEECRDEVATSTNNQASSKNLTLNEIITTQRGGNTSARAAVNSIPDFEDIPVGSSVARSNHSGEETIALSDYFKKMMNDVDKEKYLAYLKDQIAEEDKKQKLLQTLQIELDLLKAISSTKEKLINNKKEMQEAKQELQ